jgi:DNA-binding NarL/FixJ family response regulator
MNTRSMGKGAVPILKGASAGLTLPHRLLLIDNCLTFRDGLEMAIARSKLLQVVGRACTAEEAIEVCEAASAHLALVDVDLPDQSGFELCQHLLRAAPKIRLVLIGYSDWEIYLLAAQTAHADGFLVRSQPTEELIAGMENAIHGSIFSQGQLQRIQAWRSTTGAKLRTLHRREWQVLQQVALGRSNREIAQELLLSENTVEKHVSNILQKLDLGSRAMMMVFIYTHHIEGLSRLPHGDHFLMSLAN